MGWMKNLCFNSAGHCCQDSQKWALSAVLHPKILIQKTHRLLELWQEEFERRRLRLKHVVKLRQSAVGCLGQIFTWRSSYSSCSIMYHQWGSMISFWGHQSEIRSESTEVEGSRIFFSKGSKNVKNVRQNNCYIAYMETQFALELIGDDRWWPWNTANSEKF